MRSSTIAGEGLFARAAIAAGTVVSRLGGRLVTWPELHAMLSDATRRDATRRSGPAVLSTGYCATSLSTGSEPADPSWSASDAG
ncbi:hypothetical protein GCM10022255_103970 [Dactylosporangium darangshiense]|uniref:Carbohydrate kinase PfkB domain-containing protein n=1 Tax=Dactylosporangium darangshiense TaxID=579108 RepID=A0ABP8DSW7_9ACTN